MAERQAGAVQGWTQWRRGVALALCLVLAWSAAGGDLDEMKKLVEQMEARHQKEMQALRDEHAKQLQELESRYGKQVRDLTDRLKLIEAEQKAIDSAHPPAATATASGDLEERVSALEADLSIQQGQQNLMMQQLQDRVELHIYGTLEYKDLSQRTSAFDLRNLAMVASAEFIPRLKTMAIVEMEPGPEGGYDMEIDQAWMEYQISDAFNPRFGLVLAPFGKFNMNHFDILNDLSSRPIMMQTVVPVSWTEPGIGAAGAVLLEGLGLEQSSLEYQVYLVNGLKNRITDQGLVGTNDIPHQDNNNNKAVVGRLGLRLGPDQEIGFSGYRGDYDTDGNAATGADIDWRFRYGPAELLGEYAVFWIDQGINDLGERTPDKMAGGYVQANYHFWFDGLDHTFLGDRFESPTFTAVARYDEVRIADDGDPGSGDNQERRFTLGLNYRPIESWAFKLEYQWNQTRREPLDMGDADGFIFSVTTSF